MSTKPKTESRSTDIRRDCESEVIRDYVEFRRFEAIGMRAAWVLRQLEKSSNKAEARALKINLQGSKHQKPATLAGHRPKYVLKVAPTPKKPKRPKTGSKPQ